VRVYERGGIENKDSTDVESPRLLRASRIAFSLKVSHVPILVECSFSMTLLPIYPEGKSCSDVGPVLVLNDPNTGGYYCGPPDYQPTDEPSALGLIRGLMFPQFKAMRPAPEVGWCTLS